MLVIKYRLVREALVILDSLTNHVLGQLYFQTIYQIQITNDSNYNHDVKWTGWLAWVILYGIPILEKYKLVNGLVYTAQQKHLGMISLLQRHNQKITV